MSILDRLKKSKDDKAEEQAAAGAPAAKEAKAEKKATKKSEKAAEKKSAKKSEKKTDKKKPAAKKAAKAQVGKTGDAYKVLLHPIITEKATVTGTYQFAVAINATKPEVKKAVQQVYGVTPAKVNMMNVAGKEVRWNYRPGQRKNWKKAIVRLKSGETINVYEGT